MTNHNTPATEDFCSGECVFHHPHFGSCRNKSGRPLTLDRELRQAEEKAHAKGLDEGRAEGAEKERNRVLGLIDAACEGHDVGRDTLMFVRQAVVEGTEGKEPDGTTLGDRVHAVRLAWLSDGRKAGAKEERERILKLARAEAHRVGQKRSDLFSESEEARKAWQDAERRSAHAETAMVAAGNMVRFLEGEKGDG